jgi:hypothetical protein
MEEFSSPYFALSNPVDEPDFYSVPKLLRRLAHYIEELGDDVVVRDINLHTKATPEGYEPTILVYYRHEPKDE